MRLSLNVRHTISEMSQNGEGFYHRVGGGGGGIARPAEFGIFLEQYITFL